MRILNKPEAIAVAVNKLAAFRKLKEGGVRVPEFTTEAPTRSAKDVWLARTVLGGSGGDGIVVLREGDTAPAAPLYVKYVPKLVEFRLHVVRGCVVFAQQKRRMKETEQDKDQKLIRNHGNGWVFCPLSLDEVSEDAKSEAIRAVASVGLDFGAVDCVLGKHDSLAYVLEINTAPGLESPGAIEAYRAAFASEVTT